MFLDRRDVSLLKQNCMNLVAVERLLPACHPSILVVDSVPEASHIWGDDRESLFRVPKSLMADLFFFPVFFQERPSPGVPLLLGFQWSSPTGSHREVLSSGH